MPMDTETAQTLANLSAEIGGKIDKAVERSETHALRLESKLEANDLRTQQSIQAIGLEVRGVSVELHAHRGEDNSRFALVWKIILGAGGAGGASLVWLKAFGG